MKYIVAVSGGVDSVVLLDRLQKEGHEIIVAHFDHGIREDSASDALFVKNLAKKYNLPFELGQEHLGQSASEDLARQRRYKFLNELAAKHGAKIVTAHHLDDLVETIAINLTRGTGWRGLAVFHPSIERPLVNFTKADLIDYAKKNKLIWQEDSTNQSDVYLRNRIRQKTLELDIDTKLQLSALRARQRELRKEVAQELKLLLGSGPRYSRYFISHLPNPVALEALRLITNKLLTRPQLTRLLHVIKTSPPQKSFQAGSGVTVQFSTRYFTL